LHKNATKCNETQGKWCKNKHGASKIIDTFETYHGGVMYNALGSHFTKNHLFCPFWSLIKWKIYFLCGKKSLVTKVVGIGNIHISAENGVNIRKFAMKLAKTRLNWVKQSEVLLGAIFCE
jgi:hypothetical protein